MMRPTLFLAALSLLVLAEMPAQAKGGFFPTYHPKPCEGGDCRGDDAQSGLPCEGLLCTFTSAKSLQRPVTESEAAQMQAKAAATAPAAAPVPPPAPAAAPARKKRKAAHAAPKAEAKVAEER